MQVSSINACRSQINFIRPISKLVYVDEILGDLGRHRTVLDVHEDSSTKSTMRLVTEVAFRKRSNAFARSIRGRRYIYCLTGLYLE